MKKKKIIIIIIGIVLVVGVFLLLTMNKNPREKLMNVLEDKQKVIDSNKEEVFLSDYKIAYENIEVTSYTFVDLDDDDIDELICKTTSYQGASVIFRYDPDTKKIYAYPINSEVLLELKKDGTIKTRTEQYIKITFDETKFSYKEILEQDYLNNKFKIDGKEVSSDDANKFIDDFANKESAEWIRN